MRSAIAAASAAEVSAAVSSRTIPDQPWVTTPGSRRYQDQRGIGAPNNRSGVRSPTASAVTTSRTSAGP